MKIDELTKGKWYGCSFWTKDVIKFDHAEANKAYFSEWIDERRSHNSIDWFFIEPRYEFFEVSQEELRQRLPRGHADAFPSNEELNFDTMVDGQWYKFDWHWHKDVYGCFDKKESDKNTFTTSKGVWHWHGPDKFKSRESHCFSTMSNIVAEFPKEFPDVKENVWKKGDLFTVNRNNPWASRLVIGVEYEVFIVNNHSCLTVDQNEAATGGPMLRGVPFSSMIPVPVKRTEEDARERDKHEYPSEIKKQESEWREKCLRNQFPVHPDDTFKPISGNITVPGKTKERNQITVEQISNITINK